MDPSIYIPDIWALDYVLAFFYMFIIYIAAFAYRSKKMEKDDDYNYFMWALSAKLFGGLGFMFLTVYYWGGGDTYSYWNTANDLGTYIFENPLDGFKILFKSSREMNWYEYKFAFNRHQFLGSNDSFTTVKITTLINMFSFKSYVVCTVLFSAVSFLGVWNMYYVFCKIYPHLKTSLLMAFFFIPTVMLWGSGILKDTITVTCIAWIVYSFINLITLKRKKFTSIVLILIASITIVFLKPYILYILYPCLFIWVQTNLKTLVSSNLLRKLIAPFIALILIISSYFLAQELSKNAGRYEISKLEETMEGFQSWHTTVAETSDQSIYTFGEMEFTSVGIVKMIIPAINVTFFRPYLWEVKNASMLLGAIEALVLMLFSLWLLIKYRFQLFRLIYQNKDILFLILFSILFGIIVGMSSYNFGALSRYKIPGQMFYVIALILINDRTNSLN